MSYEWGGSLFDTWHHMRDAVVDEWLTSNDENAPLTYKQIDVEEIIKEIHKCKEARHWMESAGLSEKDVRDSIESLKERYAAD